MLTAELIKGQKVLKGLSDDQVQVLITLSENATKAEVETAKNQIFGEIHGQYDKVFAEVLGLQKPEGRGIKSSEFWAGQMRELKKAVEAGGNAAKIEELQATVTDLEQKIKEGKGSEAMIAKLEQDKAELAKEVESLWGKYKKSETEWEQKYKEQERTEIESLLRQEIADLKFNDTIPESVRKMVIGAETRAILNEYEVKVIESPDGSKTLQYLKDGIVHKDKNNALTPFTSKDLFTQRPAVRDIISTKLVQTGGGTKNKKTGTITGEIVDVGSPRNKVEAMDNIKAALRAKAIPVTDPRHQKIIDATWKQVVNPMFPEGKTVR